MMRIGKSQMRLSVIAVLLAVAAVVPNTGAAAGTRDTLVFKDGRIIAAMIESVNPWCASLEDGSLAAFKLLSEIRTPDENIANGIRSYYPEVPVVRQGGTFIITVRELRLKRADAYTSESIGRSEFGLNLTTAEKELVEFQFTVIPTCCRVLAIQFSFSTGEAFRQTSEFARQCAVGIGVHVPIGWIALMPMFHAAYKGVRDNIGPGTRTGTVTYLSLSLHFPEVGSPIFLAGSIRYHPNNLPIRGEIEYFSASFGIGYTFGASGK